MNRPPPVAASAGGRVLALAPSRYDGHDAIEGFFDGLDRASPAAERSILDGPRSRDGHLQVAALELAARSAHADAAFIVETQTSLGLDLLTRDASVAPAIYSIGLPLAGTMHVVLADGAFSAQAGEGLIIDPREAERIQVTAGTHFVEFDLPKACLMALGAELAPGAMGGAPRFAPRLRADLAQRLLFMALQASQGALQPGALPAARQVLSRRWNEMIALTLLSEQPMVDAPRPLAVGRGPSPASLRRALEYIHGHAEREIQLSDIAAAACVSGSSLLRLFQQHLGQSPGAFVRQVRLDRARAELRRGHPGSVRELAQRWGFQNASKFSQAYLRRFGERPRETRDGPG